MITELERNVLHNVRPSEMEREVAEILGSKEEWLEKREKLKRFTANTRTTPERLVARYENARKGVLLDLTKNTRAITEFVRKFPGNDVESLQELFDEVMLKTQLETVENNEKKFLKYLYLTRTAGEILGSGRVPFYADPRQPHRMFVAGVKTAAYSSWHC